jgi:hypothetical protein
VSGIAARHPHYVVNDGEYPEASTAGELAMHEVQRPACIRPSLDQDRRSGAYGTPTGPTLAHDQTLLTVEPIDAVDPRRLAFAPKRDE